MQLFVNLLVFLSVFSLALASPEELPAAELAVRQTTTTTTTGTDTSCADYSKTANMSVIGTNSTYRSAFLIKSPVGTIPNARMFSAAQKKLPALTADAALNQRCGNLTQIAITEAANNFSAGIVAQFTTQGLPTSIENGPIVVVIVGLITMAMSSVWLFSD